MVHDHAWGLLDTAVLQLRAEGRDYIVKAAGAQNHHIGREITAHESATGPWLARGRAARMVRADRAANILATEYLTGDLVAGTPWEHHPDTHRQAGELLRVFHDQCARPDPDAEGLIVAKAMGLLDAEHRIAGETEAAARQRLRRYRPKPTTVVPTHGDWQPRNWLHEGGVVKIIDFGRFAWRPSSTDLCRLAAQQWQDEPESERAFLEGYGRDPRDEKFWPVLLLCEAIGTAVWAFQVGDERFEAQGHRMLVEAIAAGR